MKIEELFVSDVTRNIPPVVYFHDQSPDKLAQEVDEYIITGGWEETNINHRRVPVGPRPIERGGGLRAADSRLA